MRSLALDSDSGNAARVIDQLDFGGPRMANLTVVDAKGPQHPSVVRHDGARPGGAKSSLQSKISKARPFRVRSDVRNEDRLPKVSGCAARSDIRTDAQSIGRCPVGFSHVWGDDISQVQTVLFKQENRTQHSLTVGFNQAADSRQNFA